MSKSWTRSALNGQSRLQSMSKSWTRSQHTTQWPKSTAVQRQLHHVPGLRRRLRSRKGSGSKSSRMPIEKLLLERLRQQRLGVFMPIEKLLATIQNEKCMRLQLHGIPIDSEIATIQLFNMICCLCIGSAAPLLWQPCFCGNHVFFQHVFCGKMGKICCGEEPWPRFGRMGKNHCGHQVVVLLLHLWLWSSCLRMGQNNSMPPQ